MVDGDEHIKTTSQRRPSTVLNTIAPFHMFDEGDIQQLERTIATRERTIQLEGIQHDP